jgi:hypothetical protein
MFTIENYKSAAHDLSLDSAYGVIENLNIQYPNRRTNMTPVPGAPAPLVNVNASVSIYSNKSAFDNGLQAIHNRQITVSNPTDNLIEIKAAIQEELSK